MDSPYRSAPGAQAVHRPRDAGIVGDIIDQFADKLAFFRELIQNSIDADTESIEVTLTYDDARQVLMVAVEDSGVGMPKEVIENNLLVLFRSTKEQDESKIGKFGVGFASVLAVKPNLVRVVSSHGGVRHTLHLYGDLSYELFDSGRANKTGTTVDLELSMKPDKVEDFVMSSWEALSRWCRHATVMITLDAFGPGGSKILSERIDGPLSLRGALVSVSRSTTDGAISAVVGITENIACSFFNHGLLLYETNEPLAGNLSFVIQDARLGHTLSRDNVRRDKYYRRALEFVRELASRSLQAEITRAMNEALLDPISEDYAELTDAVYRSNFETDHREWPLPLIDPLGTRRTIDIASFVQSNAWVADERSPLTVALSQTGVPVVDRLRTLAPGRPGPSTPATSGGAHTESADWFSQYCGSVRSVEDHMTLLSPEQLGASDLLLVEALSDALERAYRRPSEIVLASLHGAKWKSLAVAGHNGAGPWLLDHNLSSRNPFRPIRRPPLVVNTRHPSVRAARELASSKPHVAAQGLARLLLLERNQLDAQRSERLLEHSLDALWGQAK